MAKKIGLTFGEELYSAGVGGLPFSWDEDGNFCFDDSITEEQKAAVARVLAAHDPLKGESRLEISRLEMQQTPRRLREAALGKDGGWLAALDVQISQLREKA